MCVCDVADALGDEVESFAEVTDEPSVWEGDGTDVSTSSWTTPSTRSLRAEREIRLASWLANTMRISIVIGHTTVVHCIVKS